MIVRVAVALITIALLAAAAATSIINAITPGSSLCTITSAQGGPADIDAEQRRNATTMVRVASDMRLPARAPVIAVATAFQESGLRNLRHGDRDSLGLFQQRPSQGWGSPTQILDPAYATHTFYSHLIRIPRWQQRPLTKVAAAIQRPDERYAHLYARHETLAKRVVAELAATTCTARGTSPGTAAIAWAKTQIGEPYEWGAEGPDTWDCSGLTQQAWHHAGVKITRTTYTQWQEGTPIPRQHLQPGDLLFFNPGPGGPQHVGLNIDGQRMIHAPQTGDVVKISTFTTRTDYLGARRPG